ncbi:MAG: hypothetical protein KC621_05140 [Myxococcales bacterium]|nr:hypothetical protein [Myxococcales bacterium]
MLLALFAACTIPEIDDLRDVLPDNRLAIDDDAFVATEVEQPSAYYGYTADGVDAIDHGVGDVLDQLGQITAFPASWVERTHTATWVPWLQDGVWSQLWARADDDGATTWAIQAKADDSLTGTWLDVVAGRVEAGSDAIQSTGVLEVAMDALAKLGMATGSGHLWATYEIREDGATVTARVQDFSDDLWEPVDGTVRYDWDRSQGGSMEWAIAADVSEPANGVLEDLRILSRWDAAGAGRADALVTGGDAGPLVFSEVECWDAAHATVFHDSIITAPEGEASSCAFGDPSEGTP